MKKGDFVRVSFDGKKIPGVVINDEGDFAKLTNGIGCIVYDGEKISFEDITAEELLRASSNFWWHIREQNVQFKHEVTDEKDRQRSM